MIVVEWCQAVRIQIYLEGDGGGAQSCLTLCGLWTVALQASLSVGFPR